MLLAHMCDCGFKQAAAAAYFMTACCGIDVYTQVHASQLVIDLHSNFPTADDQASVPCNIATLANTAKRFCWCCMQVAAIVPFVQQVSGQQEGPWLPARPVAWARRPLLALSALPPVSVFLEGVVQHVPCAQQAPGPQVGQQPHAPAAQLEPQLSVPAMMNLQTASVSQGKPPLSCFW
jgi:hypothetical protein